MATGSLSHLLGQMNLPQIGGSPLRMPSSSSSSSGESFGSSFGKSLVNTAGSGIVSGLINQGFGAWTAARDYKYWKKRVDYQNQLQKEWFNMTNEYNDPSNERKRLEAAGLSPALMYGGSGAGASISAAAADMPGSPSGAGAVSSTNNPTYDALSASVIQLNQAKAREADASAGQLGSLDTLIQCQQNTEEYRQQLLDIMAQNEAFKAVGQNLSNLTNKLDYDVRKLNYDYMMTEIKFKTGEYDKDGNDIYSEVKPALLPFMRTLTQFQYEYYDQTFIHSYTADYFQSLRDNLSAIGENLKILQGESGLLRFQNWIQTELKDELLSAAKSSAQAEKWRGDHVSELAITEAVTSVVNSVANAIGAGAAVKSARRPASLSPRPVSRSVETFNGKGRSTGGRRETIQYNLF